MEKRQKFVEEKIASYNIITKKGLTEKEQQKVRELLLEDKNLWETKFDGLLRPDLMPFLMKQGIDRDTSFSIMESVRKKIGLTSEWVRMLKEKNVPIDVVESYDKGFSRTQVISFFHDFLIQTVKHVIEQR